MSTLGAKAPVVSRVVARTPVGATAGQSCAAIRAGIARFSDHAYYCPTTLDPGWDEEEPLVVATIPSIDPMLDGVDRIVGLLRPLLLEIVESSQLLRSHLARTGIFLALPEPSSSLDDRSLDRSFLATLLADCGLEAVRSVDSTRQGHTGVFEALRRAAEQLEAGAVDRCIVGGVDSYLLEARLDQLDESWRIRSARNVDGFIPGEAGGLLLIEPRRQVEARGDVPLAALASFGVGRETNSIAGDRASTAVGLATALRKALDSSSRAPSWPWVLCDLNGESYRAFEWGTVLARLPEVFGNVASLVHPASSIGDVGSATGAILIACACAAFARSYSPAADALLWTASDDGHRFAITLRQAMAARQ